MKIKACSITLLAGALVASGPVQAQDAHPFLDSTFIIGAGAFFPTQGLNLAADGTLPGEEVDFDSALGVDDSEITPAVNFRWNFTDKWSMWGQWWKTNTSGSDALNSDIVWDGILFKEGTTVGAGVDVNVLRFFVGRELWSGPQYEFGLGVGLHWLKIGAYIEGQAFTDLGDTQFKRAETDVSAPLPDIGFWYYYSPAEKWLLSARVDWLSANVGKYDGSLWDAAVGVNYAFTDHFGLSVEYVFFNLDVNIDDNDWQGSANIKNNGPIVALTANW